ncbi:FAD-binding oxidoreductase [Amycolatopsis sp. NPDC059027]|uniref:FAD-binding oxidoreductase n=1 Tax=Amycolatopsis sp. NPDC059027 TaxID=3346709 RepID=UPI00366BA268
MTQVSEITTLTGQVHGPVFQPGQDGYTEEVAGFQTGVPSSPAVVVGATRPEDVAAAVRFAASHDLPVAVQSTGHGLVTGADGGVLISTRRMTGVEIDPATSTARAEAGVHWGAVITAAAEHGLAPLSGSAPDVGVVGYTLGGGFSLMGRKYGRAADQVRALDVVTADGELRHVTADTEAELFQALLLGGRDNFGIVTSLEFGLVPVTTLYGGGLYFGPEHLGDVLRGWRDWAATAPEEVTTSVAMVPMPDLPMVPEPLRGKHIAQIRIAYLGDADAGERLVEPLRAIGPRLIDSLTEMPFTKSGSIANEPPHPHAYRGDNTTTRELTDPMIDTILELAGPDAPVETVLLVDLLGGKLALENDAARFTVRALSIVDSETAGEVKAAHGKLFTALRPWSTGKLLTFVYGEHDPHEQAPAAFGEPCLRRLTEVKAKYDPSNVFRLSHNIRPS